MQQQTVCKVCEFVCVSCFERSTRVSLLLLLCVLVCQKTVVGGCVGLSSSSCAGCGGGERERGRCLFLVVWKHCQAASKTTTHDHDQPSLPKNTRDISVSQETIRKNTSNPAGQPHGPKKKDVRCFSSSHTTAPTQQLQLLASARSSLSSPLPIVQWCDPPFSFTHTHYTSTYFLGTYTCLKFSRP